MMQLRLSEDRGRAQFGWLDSRHTFSFGHYYDPSHMGFGSLRVINEDRVAPGGGFETHGHRNMEIISYVLSGALRHEDNMGNGSTIYPGDVQVMSAGTGVLHSEFNASDEEDVHFLQMWVLPRVNNLEPGYRQKSFTEAEKQNQLKLVGSADGRAGSVLIQSDVDLYAGILTASSKLGLTLIPNRRYWLHAIHGGLTANGSQMSAGDGLALTAMDSLTLVADTVSELLLFDMA